MRMGYNMMNVMCLGIEFSSSARLQGFRCAPPPACGLPPLTGLNGWAFFIRLYVGFHRPYTGVPLRSTACLCSAAPDGAKWMGIFHSFVCGFSPPVHRGFAALHRLPVFCRP